MWLPSAIRSVDLEASSSPIVDPSVRRSLSTPLDQVAQFADHRGQLVLLFLSLRFTFLSRLNRLPDPSDLDLLD
jgi:hypothetical protein